LCANLLYLRESPPFYFPLIALIYADYFFIFLRLSALSAGTILLFSPANRADFPRFKPIANML